MARVFICYSRRDRAFADRLCADLRAAGVPTWRDIDDIPRDIVANTTLWRDAVERALNECTQMIVILSPDSVVSVEVKREADYFLSAGKPVYPVLFRECKVPYWLHGLERRDLRDYNPEELARLVSLLPHEQPASPPSKLPDARLQRPPSAGRIRPRRRRKRTLPGWVWIAAAMVVIGSMIGGLLKMGVLGGLQTAATSRATGEGVTATLGRLESPAPSYGSVPTSSVQPPPATAYVPTPASLAPAVEALFGSVEVRAGLDDTPLPLTSRRLLAVGDAIQTGEGSAALVILTAGMSIEVHPESELALERLEIVDDTLVVELRQWSGTTYHILTPDLRAQNHDYQLHTPVGVAQAVGTRYWAIAGGSGWRFVPTEGSIRFETGEPDADIGDDHWVDALINGCLWVDAASNVSGCDVPAGLVALTDGSQLVQTAIPTSTAAVVIVATWIPTPVPTPTASPIPTQTLLPGAVTRIGTTPLPDCGNGICGPGESNFNCPADCQGTPSGCGYCGAGGCFEEVRQMGCWICPSCFGVYQVCYTLCNSQCDWTLLSCVP